MSPELRPGTPAEAGMSDERVRHVVDLARGWVDEGVHPALVVLVARKGVVVIHEAFGRLTPADDSPPQELDTIFPLMSLTKPITATAAMILVEDGLLGLNRPVWWYLPEFAGEGKDVVMVHHLLTHTSGMRDEDVEAHAESQRGRVGVPACTDANQHPLIHEYLHLRWGAPQWKPPGVEMYYCNHGYNLVGEIVRRVSGRSLADFARDRIFEPLGMVDTHCASGEDAWRRVVKRGENGLSAWIDGRDWHAPWGAGGAFSTATHMAAFAQMFLNGGCNGGARVLSPWSVAEMTRNQIPGIGTQYEDFVSPEACWGLGWSLRGSKNNLGYGETPRSGDAFCHGGLGGVFLWADPVHQIVGVYFAVQSAGGVPEGAAVPESLEDWYGYELYGRTDLFVNAVTAAVLP